MVSVAANSSGAAEATANTLDDAGGRTIRGLVDHGRKVKATLELTSTQRHYDGEEKDEVPRGKGRMIFANDDFLRGQLRYGKQQSVHYLYYATLAGRAYLQLFFQGQPCGKGLVPASKKSGAGGGEAREATVTAASLCDDHTLAAGDASKTEAALRAAKGMRAPNTVVPAYAALLLDCPSTVVLASAEQSCTFTADAALTSVTFSFQEAGSTAAAAAAAVSVFDEGNTPCGR
ncbi:hypothetical protein LdCL_260031000 [Leishmania donovani]|uniref:Uncharacterized protein n=1 Tax=Leishmania donovani TaxID=5661 RepID=A0A3Q8IE04_LEIDO|nr:hypothetical protein LdCL_260031000 [Leishmania donovani]